jgi:Tol biopolymer transport system component
MHLRGSRTVSQKLPVALRRPSMRVSSVSLGPILSLVTLAVVATLSLGLLGGPLPALGINRAQTNTGDVPNRTPDPVKVFIPAIPQTPEIRGSILFAKAGNIWTVSGADALTQRTSGGHDQYPSWSHDGATIYFLALRGAQGTVPCSMVAASGCISSAVHYTLDYPVLSRMPAGAGGSTAIQSGLYSWAGGQFTYFYGLWQPAVSADGKTVALITDAPDPFSLDYQLAFMPSAGGQLTRAPLAEDSGLGHNDPTWSPDGRVVAYTYNHRDGTLAQPRIALYNVRTGASRFLTTFGYAEPSFSPNGRWIAAIRTSAKGEDVVILDASSGAELLRVTNDGHSFEPVWSPAGDQLAFLRANGLSIDLWADTLGGSGNAFSVTKEEPVTSQSALDGTSKPSWFIPAAEMPSPSAALPSSLTEPSASGGN